MAESSKKHSRKSKLVPRECIEIDDVVPTSSELEEAIQSIPQSTSLLPKIKNTIDEDSFKESSPNPVELCVQVQVESCSDDDPTEPNLYNDDDEEKYNQEQKKMLAKMPKREIIIYPDTIRAEVDKTAQKIKWLPDKQLDIFIRNSLSRYMKTLELDYYEHLLQEVLLQWRVWVSMSKIRTYILAFKCDICCEGWWHLQPFEDHIRNHKKLTLQLETYHHDCVITAAAGDWYESVCQVFVEGNCPRCLNDFESHMKPKRLSMYYNCKACFERFPTCQRMFNHEGMCVRYEKMMYKNSLKHDEQWHCQLCNIECLSEERHTQHFLGCHDVRSDEPVSMQNFKDCNQCGIKYFVYNLHLCPKRTDNFKCTYCFRKFQNKFVQDFHENNLNSSCYCPVCNKFLKKQCMLYEHFIRHSKLYAIALKCQECADNVLVPSEHLMAVHKGKYHEKRSDRKNLYETLIVPKQCLTLKLCESVSVQDMVLERKKAPPKKTESDQEMLRTLGKIMIQRQEYEGSVERQRQAEEDAVQQEQHELAVKDISKELANKFLKRATNLQVVAKYDSEVASAVDSIKFDNNDHSDNDNKKTDFDDDNVNSEDDLSIDDDDIGETESSVNALLNQIKMKKEIKHEIDIEEPDLTRYMALDDSQDDFKLNINDSATVTGVSIKTELFCNETLETDGVDNDSPTVSIKTEKLEPQLSITEESQDSDCIEVKIPDSVQTEYTKENEINLETNIVVKTEPIDSYEMDTYERTIQNDNNSKVSENVTPKTESVAEKEKPTAEEVENNKISIKEEAEDYQEFDMDTEDDIAREQEACLEELSKVFQASNSSKEVKLSNICGDEIKVKDEPMDDDEDFEQDIIITNSKQDFEVTVHSEALNTCFSDKSTDTANSVDLTSLEPEVSISEESAKAVKKKCSTSKWKNQYSKRRLYSCNKCDFTGEHKNYMAHIAATCPRMSKNSRSFKKEVWTDIQCSKCDKKILTLRQYLAHLHSAHRLKLATCPQCFKEFPNLSCTITHLAMHIKRNFVKIQILKELAYFSSQMSGVHQCKVCNEEVFYKNFFSHWEKHMDFKFEDDEENDSVLDESAVDNDIGDASNNAAVTVVRPEIKNMLDQLELPPTSGEADKRCCACDRRFERRNDTKRHLIEHLLKAAYDAPGYGLACQLCGDSFDKADGYKVHMRRHGSLPVFRCEMCRKCFSDSSNFAKHKKVHNLQALKCDTCKRKFQSKKQLEKHMELHRTTKPIKCELCERVFPLPADYRKHMRSNHSTRGGVNYCRICRKREFTKRELWDHLWLVHRVRLNDADCLICDKSFRKYSDVRAHMRLEHHLNASVTIKTLQKIRALSAAERADKIRELLSTTYTVSNPSSNETFVIYE